MRAFALSCFWAYLPIAASGVRAWCGKTLRGLAARLLEVTGQRAVYLAQALCDALRVEPGAFQRGVGVVVVVVFLGAFLPDAVEGVGRDVVQVNEFHGRFCCRKFAS